MKPKTTVLAVLALLRESRRPMTIGAIHKALNDRFSYGGIASAVARLYKSGALDRAATGTTGPASGPLWAYFIRPTPTPPSPAPKPPTYPNGSMSRIEIAAELEALMALIAELRRKV